jgi:hypothetical protein
VLRKNKPVQQNKSMKKVLILLMFLAMAPFAEAQLANVLYGNISSFGLAGRTNLQMKLSILSPKNRIVNNSLVSNDPLITYSDQNGNFQYTNVIFGYYVLSAADSFSSRWPIVVYADTAGSNNLINLVNFNAAIPPPPSTNYYNIYQINQMLSSIVVGVAATNVYAYPYDGSMIIFTNSQNLTEWGFQVNTNMFPNFQQVSNIVLSIGGGTLTNINFGASDNTLIITTNGIASFTARVNTNIVTTFLTATNIAISEQTIVLPGANVGIMNTTNAYGQITATISSSGGGGAATNVSLGNIDGTISVITNSAASWNISANQNAIVTHTAVNAAGASTNAYLQQVFTPEQFGSAANGNEVHDVSVTNGTAIINSPTVNFSAADVGKPLTLYLDATNLTYLQTTIFSVQSASQATLAATVSGGWTNNGTIIYGSDNTANFQALANAAHAAGGGVIKLKSGIYYLAGQPILRTNAQDESSVISLPCTYIRQSPTNKLITIEFDGAYAAGKGINVDNNWPSLSGTIIFCPSSGTLPNTGTNINCIFGMNDLASDGGDFSLEQYVFKNITVRKIRNTPLCGFFAGWGGGLVIEDSSVDVDYGVGDQENPPNYNSKFIPTNSVVNPWTDTGIWTPGVNNDSNVKINRVMVYGYGCGIEAGEHAFIQNTELEYNGCNLSIFSSMPPDQYPGQNGAGVDGENVHLLGGVIQMSDFSQEYVAYVNLGPVYFENRANTITEVNDTTGGILMGTISYNGPKYFSLNFTSTNLNQIWCGNSSYPPWIKGTFYGNYNGNGYGLTNLPFFQTISGSGFTFTTSQNANGSSNLNLTVAGGGNANTNQNTFFPTIGSTNWLGVNSFAGQINETNSQVTNNFAGGMTVGGNMVMTNNLSVLGSVTANQTFNVASAANGGTALTGGEGNLTVNGGGYGGQINFEGFGKFLFNAGAIVGTGPTNYYTGTLTVNGETNVGTFTNIGDVGISGALTIDGNVTSEAGQFSGSGAGLTAVPAGQLTGTAPLGVIPAGIPSQTLGWNGLTNQIGVISNSAPTDLGGLQNTGGLTNQGAALLLGNSNYISGALTVGGNQTNALAQTNLVSDGAPTGYFPTLYAGAANLTGTIPFASLPAPVLTNNQVGPVNLGTNNTCTMSNLNCNGSIFATNLLAWNPSATPTNAFVMLDATGTNVLAVKQPSITNLLSLTSIPTFALGTQYINQSNAPIYVAQNSLLTGAAVAGYVSCDLCVVGTITNYQGAHATATGITADTTTNFLSDIIPAGATYYFTNLSTGSGNSGALIGTGQITVF